MLPSSRKIVTGLISLCLIIFLSSCAGSGQAPSKAKASAPSTPVIAKNALSGRVGEDNAVLAVKIDDTKFARPQIGLAAADLVYIEQVEGGMTRLAAIYSSHYPTQIGPVRSARISDIELLAQFGKVAFAFSGSQRKLRPVIEAADLFNLGAEHEPPSVYSRDQKRRAPWNMILNPAALFERAGKRNLELARAKNMGWSFKKKSSLGIEIVSAEMKWPGARYEIFWSGSSSGWLINQNGTRKEDASGLPIVASTFVAQVVSITNSEYGDKFGEITPLVTTVGEGRAYVFRDGKVIVGKWSRPTTTLGTSFTTDEGEEIAFAAGQIWFALVGKDPEILFLPEPSSPPTPQEAQSAGKPPTK